MKTDIRILFTALLATFFYTAAFAQVGRIEQTIIQYDKQNVEALTVNMKPERKDIQKAFDDWMDDRYDISMKGGGLFSDKNIRTAEAVQIPAISPDKVTLISKTEERNGATHMSIFASRGLGNYIESDDYAAFTGLEDIFDGFLSTYLPEYYEERVAEAREELEDLRGDIEDVRKDINKNEEDIRDLQQENDDKRKEVIDLETKISGAEQLLRKREDIKREVRRQVTGIRK
jgi:cell division protein FtsB